jgi:hypothetical protein
LSVFPLSHRQKKPPKQFKWEQFQHRLPTQEQLKAWFDGNDNNIAIVTGAISRLLVFDIDGDLAKYHADDIIRNKIRQDTRDAILDTLRVETGSGGLHVIVRYNPEEFKEDSRAVSEIKNSVLWRDRKNRHTEIRLKSDGGYVVAVPSIHPNGNPYRFLKEASIAELSKEQILDLIQGFRKIGGNNNCKTRQRQADNKHNDQRGARRLLLPTIYLDDEQIMDMVVSLKQYYLQGQRNDFVLFLGGWLRKEGIALESARKIIEELGDNDEELPNRLTTLEATYQKDNFDDIKGFSGLVEILAAEVGSEDTAIRILKEIQSTILLLSQPQSIESDDDDATVKRGGTQNPESSDNEEATSTRAKKIANKLIDLVESNCPLLFIDQYNKPHAWATVVTATGQQYREVIPIESRRFETYVSGLYFHHSYGEIANKEAIADTIRILAAKTLFQTSMTKELHLRVACRVKEKQEQEDEIYYYDLTDPMKRYIRITNQGWQLIPHTQDVLFRKFGQLPQVEPIHNYPHDIFDKFLDLMHITDAQQRLLCKVLIISYFIPDIPRPILITHGEKGSVKTTFCKCIKALVDPSMPNILTILSDKLEFAQQLNHNHVVVYDNVKSIPHWFSDEVCKAVTGGGISKRQKFTDDDDIVYEYKRCVIINGINIALTEPDALDRSILLEFKRLSDDKRKSESEVLAEFEKMRPLILGYIFDILVKALQIKPALDLKRLPRMADFAIWGEAIAQVMGYKEFEFLDAYNANLGLQNIEAIDSTLLGPVLVNFVNNLTLQATATNLWEGRAEELLKVLDNIAASPEFGIDIKKARDWPKKGNRLTKMLRPMLSNLREGYGIFITIESDTTGKKTGTKNARWIEIRKVASPSPPSSPEPNQAKNDGESGEDICLDGEDSISTAAKLSSPKVSETDAHFEKSEDGEGGGDTLRLPSGGGANNSSSSFSPLVDGKNYVAFDLEWKEDNGIGSRTVYAAAFVDNYGNKKVLHISDFAGSEPALLRAIIDEILKYPASIGWYTTGIASGGGVGWRINGNQKVVGRGVFAA